MLYSNVGIMSIVGVIGYGTLMGPSSGTIFRKMRKGLPHGAFTGAMALLVSSFFRPSSFLRAQIRSVRAVVAQDLGRDELIVSVWLLAQDLGRVCAHAQASGVNRWDK